MRPSLWIPAALVFIFLVSIDSPCQSSASPAVQSSDALRGAYDKAMQGKDWAGAVAVAQQMVQAKPTAENLRLLGGAQMNANALPEAIATLDRALAQAQADKPAEGQPLDDWKELEGKIWLAKGNALLKSRRTADAVEAYNRAAELAKNPAVATFNICATFYNIGDVAQSTIACRRAVAVDPANANAWFVLGSDLFVDAKADAQGKFVITAECRQALEKYMQLAPGGPHAADVKAMLDMSAK
jgi:tetratricopeptide (TPR) repeat protein